MTGTVHAAPATIAKWKRTVAPLRVAPTLRGAIRRFSSEWLESYLVEPHDLRPALPSTMPRLGLGREQARDIVANHASQEPEAKRGVARPAAREGRVEAGKRQFAGKKCASCHAFSGAGVEAPPRSAAGVDPRAWLLAPDLRVTRDRYRPEALAEWLRDPQGQKSDTLMPNHALTPDEAGELARYLVATPLAPRPPVGPTRRLPVLERRVAYAEVQERVLGVTCGHCHGNPDVAFGDGGPGNTGGFGFPARGLDLTSYGKVASGWVDPEGHRHSVFEPLADGTPRLVASLLARHEELAGRASDEVRGMPLGLPPVALADIQLVDTWIAQGRPR
jgi:mono/diheme cytochrome c family protein